MSKTTNLDREFLEMYAECNGDGTFCYWKGEELLQDVKQLCKERAETIELYNQRFNSFEVLIIPTLRINDSTTIHKLNKNNGYKLTINN